MFGEKHVFKINFQYIQVQNGIQKVDVEVVKLLFGSPESMCTCT